MKTRSRICEKASCLQFVQEKSELNLKIWAENAQVRETRRQIRLANFQNEICAHLRLFGLHQYGIFKTILQYMELQ
jgi:hypothetical protein